jgi:cytochrome c-type biogenesis protein CcmE
VISDGTNRVGPPGRREDDPESSDAGPDPRDLDPGVWDPGVSGPGASDPREEARALLAGAGRPHSRHWLGSRRRQVFAGVVVLGAIGFLAFQGLTNATEYFETTAQAVTHRATLGTRPFRIEGTVENDVTTRGADILFTIYGPGQAVRVVSTGSPPELFKPGIPVVLEGHWQGDVYMSDQIMVKHTASYTEAHPDRLKPQTPPGSAPAK